MLTRTLRGRGALLATSLIALAACAGCGVVHTGTALGPTRKLVIAIDSQPSALFAPIYEALANGDFARGALSVSVTAPTPTEQPLSELTQDRASVAIVSEPALLAARDAGEPLVAIGALVRGPLQSIISLKPISSPTGLVGRTVATDGTPLAAAELASYLATAAVSPVRVHTIDAASNLNGALRSHKAIATLGGLWNYDAIALAQAHHPPSVIQLTSAGVPTYSELVIAVRVSEARYEGPLLRAFLQSLTRGEAATRANPATVASLLTTINPQLSRKFELAVLNATDPVTQPTGAGQPFGFQSPYQWRTFGNWMTAHGLLSHTSDAGVSITNEFLPGQGE
jgi:putative hydroxymethylpyrimidine transport system substrate-binding protein